MKTRKLTLSVDDLQVTSFEAGPRENEAGTVKGHALFSNPFTCATQCVSFCLADTDCCPDYTQVC